MRYLKLILMCVVLLICGTVTGTTTMSDHWCTSISGCDSLDSVDVTQLAQPGIKYIALVINNNNGGSYGPQDISIYCNDSLHSQGTLGTGEWEECGENEDIRVFIDFPVLGIASGGSILAIPASPITSSVSMESLIGGAVAGSCMTLIIGGVTLLIYKYCSITGRNKVVPTDFVT
jgi:hypothetical protein